MPLTTDSTLDRALIADSQNADLTLGRAVRAATCDEEI
jgi:hypothetical protein